MQNKTSVNITYFEEKENEEEESPIITNNDENITILLDDIDTEINIEYLLSKLSNKEYKVVINEEKE